MKLKLNGMVVECVIGDRPDERQIPQALRVDVEIELHDNVAETDQINDTVDYSTLAHQIRLALSAAKCRMIERAAKVVADACMAHPNVISAKASVAKFHAVPGLESAEAVYVSK